MAVGARLGGRILQVAMAAAIAAGANVPQAGAQTKQELDAVKADLAIVKRELRDIKNLLRAALQQRTQRRAPPPTSATVWVKDRPVLGKTDAPVTIVEFSDYQCPFCRRFAATTLPLLKKEYLDTGKARLIYRDFPLTSIHKRAVAGAKAAHCAGEQGKYWQMHDLIFANSRDLSDAAFKGHAAKLALDDAKFGECLSSGRYDKQIDKDFLDGQNAGVRGTPTFFIGPTGKGDTITGLSLRGAQPFPNFKRAIETVLAAQAKTAKAKAPNGKAEKPKAAKTN